HDMNRFLWATNGDKRKLKLAALCQFTLPNPPIIYYGTEVGLSQLQAVGRLEESRLPMLWDKDQDQDLLTFYQQLIQLRRQDSQYWYQQQLQAVILDDVNCFYGYQLGNYMIALNNQDQSITLALPNWKNYQLAIATDPAILWNKSTGELTLPPFGGVILLS
ncbi:MAG: alpha-amylase family glycosyl hydrolase, partial [Microcystaceae cyanobacterium]